MPAKRVLIIDDERDFTELLAESLEAEGFIVTSANDPADGINHIKNGVYGTLLMDYKMRGLDGIEVLKKIKEEKIKMNIFLVSGRPFLDKILEKEGLSGMVRGVIMKPVKFEILLEKVKSASNNLKVVMSIEE